MRKHLDQLDDAVLQAVRGFFEGNWLYGDWAGIVRDVETLQAGGRGVPMEVSASGGWRVQATRALRAVVDPQELEWTSNIDISDADFAGRGLQVLKMNSLQRQPIFYRFISALTS